MYRERIQRVYDAVACKVPDRVPTVVDFGFFAAKYAGISIYDAYYDVAKWKMAIKKTVLDFQPDVHHSLMFYAGSSFDAVASKMYRWPGHGLDKDHSSQFVEEERMRADEYDAFINDPTDFILRTYLPRVMGAAAPFAGLPHLSSLSMLATGMGVPFFHSPELVAACKGIYEASRGIARVWDARTALVNEMQALGYPGIYQIGGGGSPFESLADNFRGLKGIMLDMYQRPAKLHAAIEKLNEISRRNQMVMRPFGGNNLMWSALLRGADIFMSKKNFEEFYWPYIKAGIEESVKNGFTPIILWEGDCTSRLEYLLDLPKGKVIHRFDRTDIFRAKEILQDHSCICGGISAPMLATGSVQDVKERCKQLIDVVGKNGGFIMSHSCQMDNLKPENMKAMIDFTREYGVY